MRSSMPAAAPGGGGGAAKADAATLVNVTVDRSQLWPVHVVLGADGTVADARGAGRRCPPPTPDGFELHFSKYSLDALHPDEKVADLGSRNFFLCAARSRTSSAAAAI